MSLEQYLTGRQIITKYALKDFQLFSLVEDGLQPYDDNGQSVPVVTKDQESLHRYKVGLQSLTPGILLEGPVKRTNLTTRATTTVQRTSDDVIADYERNIARLEATGIELPDLDSRQWQDRVVLSDSKETVERLKNCYYSHAEVVEKCGDLPENVVIGGIGLGANAELASVHFRYLDPSYEYFAKKLNIAVTCWTSLFGERGTYKEGSKKAIRNQIGEWLDVHAENLSPTAKNHIISIVNPNKLSKGGVRKSTKK